MARRHQDIFQACSRGDKDAVSCIISAGTDPRQVRNPNRFGETLLHNASRYVMFCMFTYLVYVKDIDNKYCGGSVAVM